jgi:heme-degrading monooxygenase HmoA
MIVRIWSARGTKARALKYLHHFREEVLPVIRETEGLLEARILTQADGSAVQLLVETVWNSWEAIDKFTKGKRDQAVVSAEAQKFFTSFDKKVRHYELALQEGRQPLHPADL